MYRCNDVRVFWNDLRNFFYASIAALVRHFEVHLARPE